MIKTEKLDCYIKNKLKQNIFDFNLNIAMKNNEIHVFNVPTGNKIKFSIKKKEI